MIFCPADIVFDIIVEFIALPGTNGNNQTSNEMIRFCRIQLFIAFYRQFLYRCPWVYDNHFRFAFQTFFHP